MVSHGSRSTLCLSQRSLMVALLRLVCCSHLEMLHVFTHSSDACPSSDSGPSCLEQFQDCPGALASL